ncbi:PH domain-containing protein [Nissabacter sp. SGAir0207]|uniref:PH domain-containing protein n=1 Tax=Nissabacter sp. SGAir0207 TaxID=2126321 RepID=UPI0010CCBBD8|nr:PH domain-containing protein [Nissabacter sp. SGAir0207]QCR38758.1 hypothetical protein C1N62_21760 [Nissabacter sp. SGAir0207]
MASYVDSNLSKGEEVITRAHVSWLSFLFVIVIGTVCLLIGLLGALIRGSGGGDIPGISWFFILVGAFLLLKVTLIIVTTELALTNKRVIAKFGFIRRTTVELRLDKVESLEVNQGIMGRLLGYGNIVVKGTGGTGTPIPSIKKPLDFRRIVNNYIEEREAV